MATKLLDFRSIKQPKVVAEDELLRYLLAFEPALNNKHIKYEWSFTHYHQVNAPADGFRSIIEYTLNKALNSPYSPEYILVFTHSFDKEMVVEFELGHSQQDINEQYFDQIDIGTLNQIYSHYDWHLSCEENHVGSLLTWTISDFSALNMNLKQTKKKLKNCHLGLAQKPQVSKHLAQVLLIENLEALTLPSQLSIILEKSYNTIRLPIGQIKHELMSDIDFDLVVIKSTAQSVTQDLAEFGSKFPNNNAPIFSIVENLSLELKLDLLEAGCTDVIAFPFSTSSLLESINTNASSQMSLRKDSKTGAVNFESRKIPKNAQTEEHNLVRVKQLVADHYHDAEFDDKRAAIIIGLPLANLDHMLNQHIYHTVKQFITSYRLANAYELIAQGDASSKVAAACGFGSLDEFESAYEAKYAQRP